MKILLLGIGNILLADEGVGVHFIHYINRKYRFNGPHELKIVDGGTLAQHLIPIMAEYDYLIIVDTLNAPGVAAGAVYFFNFDAVPENVDWQGTAHEVEMLQTLTMMELHGDRPTTMILGVIPTIIEPMRFELSEGVRKAIEPMETTLLEHLAALGMTASVQEAIAIETVLPQTYKASL